MKHRLVYVFILLSPVLFFSPKSALALHTISDAEYFIDHDPGEGKGIPIQSEDGIYNSSSEEISFEINLSELTVGSHFLYIRMENEAGIWGIPNKHLFMVTGIKTIEQAEYFIDDDPGKGNGTPLTVKDGQVETELDSSSLSVGMHTLFIRMKNSEGNWGVARKYTFEVSGSSPTMKIKAAECFINIDPGIGEGTALSASDGDFDEAEELFKGEIDISDLDEGSHTLYIRAGDSLGRWTQPPQQTAFNVPLEPTPISPLNPPTNLEARSGADSVSLTWNPSTSAYLAGYNVYQSLSPDSGYTRINTQLVAGDYYADNSDLIKGVTYYYYLTSVDSSEKESDPSNAASTAPGQIILLIPDTRGKSGDQVRIPINIANANDLKISGLNVHMTFDSSVLSATNVERTPLSSGYAWTLDVETPGVARALIASPEAEMLYGGGSLFYVLFDVKGDKNTTTLKFQEAETAIYELGSDGRPVKMEVDLNDTGIFTLDGGYNLGDLNGDGIVDSADIILTLQIAVGNVDPTETEKNAGDVSGDGYIRSNDAAPILRIWKDKPLAPTETKRKVLSRISSVNVSVPGSTLISAGESAWIPIEINNATDVMGADIILNYDSSLVTATDCRTTLMTGNFTIKINKVQAGQIKIALSAMDGEGLPEISGTLAEVQFTAKSDTSGISPLTLTSVRLNDSYGRDFVTSALQINITTSNGNLTVGDLNTGDIDRSGTIDLQDAILGLKVLAGISEKGIYTDTEVSGDRKTGMEEVIYVLQFVSGIRP